MAESNGAEGRNEPEAGHEHAQAVLRSSSQAPEFSFRSLESAGLSPME